MNSAPASPPGATSATWSCTTRAPSRHEMLLAATNMLKKFTNEGYAGDARVLLGGYTNFAAAYPDLVDHNRNPPASNSPPLNMAGGRRLTLPLVIGGVALPGSDADSSKNKPEAFFSNIRQNMDLADRRRPHGPDRPPRRSTRWACRAGSATPPSPPTTERPSPTASCASSWPNRPA